MSCQLPVLKRGANQTWTLTVYDADGLPRPFAADEYAILAIGRIAPNGSEVLQKSTAVSGEGYTVLGSPVATFLFVPADGTSLPQPSYNYDAWLFTAEGHVLPIGEPSSVQVEGRVATLS